MDAKPLLIFGARLWAEEVADLISEIPGVELVGFVENLERERCQRTLLGLPVYWIDDVAGLASSHVALGGLGTTLRRPLLEQAEKMGFQFTTLVHPGARIAPSATLGAGVLVGPAAVVASHTCIGSHVILNRGVLVGHHLNMGSFCTVAPGANLGGASTIGEGVFIGIGATLVDRLNIGDGSVIGAGSVVTRDVPPHVLAYGSPARVIKEGIEGR